MRTIDDIIDDIVSCADIADGGKADARAYARELCEVVRAQAAQKWQTMETAPKDETRILLCWANGAASVAYWSESYAEGVRRRGYADSYCWLEPVSDEPLGHEYGTDLVGWMPIPEPPR